MPNRGHISCEDCTYNRRTPGTCDVFGIETGAFVICRMFRMPQQSHQQAREQWSMLEQLKPGIAYRIDNSVLSAGNPRPTEAWSSNKRKQSATCLKERKNQHK